MPTWELLQCTKNTVYILHKIIISSEVQPPRNQLERLIQINPDIWINPHHMAACNIFRRSEQPIQKHNVCLLYDHVWCYSHAMCQLHAFPLCTIVRRHVINEACASLEIEKPVCSAIIETLWARARLIVSSCMIDYELVYSWLGDRVLL